MQNNDFRAKQFMPFDSLKGFYDMLKCQEKNEVEKNILSEDYCNYLDNKLKNINKGDNVCIKYYYDMDYIETYGIIRKIDKINKSIYILNSNIKFDDILEITKY